MSHAYRQLIAVESKPGYGDDLIPTAFVWRGERYEVLHVNEPWHLMDKWWEPVPETNAASISRRWSWLQMVQVRPGMA